jgi:hypothetical protein
VRIYALMIFEDDKKQYVTPEQSRKEFPTGVGIWTDCAQCGAPLIVPEHGAPFCNGLSASGCGSIPARLN